MKASNNSLAKETIEMRSADAPQVMTGLRYAKGSFLDVMFIHVLSQAYLLSVGRTYDILQTHISTSIKSTFLTGVDAH